ncbi:uncharacterized protein LOC107359930 [Tetranychus urticae]|uniref:ALMS motif domain-containing protein n=1 Tax=Tetranychus urticae TaxID=32264 RepID=T1K1I7_TETUR|nr:uncharacterized protein LOC107359930 [Tetranychus urticae]
MKDSISSNQSTSGTYSSSLDDLTSLSSISSELTSLEPISSNQSTISSCNKSLLDEDKCNYMSSDSETLASPSFLINRELRQRLTMLSSDLDESDSKSDTLDTLSGNLSDMSDPSDEDNSSQSGIVKELYEHSIVHKTHDNLGEAEIANHLNNFEHLEGSDSESSTKSNLSAEESDNSSISVADDDPAREFKDLIKKQKVYLDNLQRELFRLQKMEQILSKLHKKSKMQKEMLNKIEICDNCEGICNSACQLPSNSKKAPDVVSKPENLHRNNYPLTDCESSNENEKEQCVNYNSSVKVKSDATTQTKPSEYTRENNIVNFPTKKERIHQIHDKVDQIIHKLYEATTMDDPDEPCHSIGVQTSNLIAPSQKLNRKMNKSACNFASSSTVDKSQKQAVYWTIPANEHKLDKSSTKFTNFLSNYHQTEVLYPGSSNLSLQQAFRERCSHILKNSESRVNRINIKSEMRKANTDCRFEQLDLMYKRDHDIIGNNGPDKVKVIKPRKMFTEKEMRKQTERLYSHLPEIKKLKEEKMKQQNGKTNRLVAKIFSQRLKSNAVHGKVTFPLTQKLTQI